MKFVIKKQELVNALTISNKAIASNNPRKILQGIKFNISEQEGLLLTSSDSDISILTKIDVMKSDTRIISDIHPGQFVVENKIVEITKQMSDEYITLEIIEESLLELYDNTSKYTLNCLEAKDYPEIDFTLDGQPVELSCSQLKNLVDQTAFATSEKDTRPILNGVNFKCNGSKLDVVATDSFRLAKKSIQINSNLYFNATIPSKSLIEVSKIAEGEGTNAAIKFSDRKCLFTFENTIVSVRVISGLFPDTDKLIRPDFKYDFTVSSDSVLSSLKRSLLVESQLVKLTISEYNATLSSRSQDAGSFSDKLENYTFTGSSFEIAFTSRYVKEAVTALNSETVTFHFNSEAELFIITSEKQPGVIQLVLPVTNW